MAAREEDEEWHDEEPNDNLFAGELGDPSIPTSALVDNPTCIASCNDSLEHTKKSLAETKQRMKERDEACMQCCYESAILKSILGKLRRLWSISPIVLGMFNTAVKVTDIASSLSLIQPDATWQYGQGIYWASSRSREPSYSGSYGAPETKLAIGNVMTFQYQTCKYSQPVSLKMGCDYSVYTAYTSFLVIWTTYFGVLGAYHLYFSIFYSTYDLRFYLSAQLANGSTFNKYYVILGHLFTLVTCIVGWSFCLINLRAGIPGQESAAAGVGVFGVLNFLALVPFSSAIFSTMAVEKPVKLFYHPDKVFLTSILKGNPFVVLEKQKKQTYAPDWDEEPITKGCEISGIGIELNTVVTDVVIEGDTCRVFMSKAVTTTHETEISFRLPYHELKEKQHELFKADYAEHYEFVDPKLEVALKKRMTGRQIEFRNGALQNGLSCGACAAVFGCNKLQGADSLVYVDKIRTEDKVTLYPGVYGYVKCGVIAMRQLRTTKGFLDEKRGVDISVIPENKTIFNGWGAALNVESVFRELQEKVLRMSMIEDFIRNPENKMADTSLGDPRPYDPTDDPPLDLFTCKEIEKKTLLSKQLKPFALYHSATTMFEVLYMAEIKSDELADLIKRMEEEGKVLKKMRQEANIKGAERIAAKAEAARMKLNEVETQKQSKTLLPSLRAKIQSTAAAHQIKRRALEDANAAAKKAILDLEQDLEWSAGDENASAAAVIKAKLEILKDKEGMRITMYDMEKSSLDKQVDDLKERLRRLMYPSLATEQIADEMKVLTDVGAMLSRPSDANRRVVDDDDGAPSGSWLQRLSAWLFGPALPTTGLNCAAPSINCAAPAINCSTQVDGSV